MDICLISLGCPKNTVDSELMLGRLLEAGHRIVPEPEAADVVIVNTCGFIDPAKEESLGAIMAALQLKRQRPALRVIAAGCLSQRYRAELTREIPELDALMGVNDIARVAEIVAGAPAPAGASLYLHDARAPRRRITPAHIAYVKISEGCSHRCAFCAIPGIRGPFRSRPPADVIGEIAALAAAEVHEIILIGQDTTAFGRDLGGGASIAALLAQAAAVPGDFWIRLMYTYPSEVDDRLLEAMARHPKICPYLDIPFQHAHRDVLRRMGRPGDGDAYLRLLERARRAVPELAVRTALITGFPGERPAHFDYLLEFVREARFDQLGVFVYSDEEGTPAHRLDGKVTSRTAARRRDRLMAAQQEVLAAGAAAWLGCTATVIVDGYSADAEMLLQARLPQQAPEIDSVVYLTDGSLDKLKPGDFVTAKLKQYVGYDFTAAAVRLRRSSLS